MQVPRTVAALLLPVLLLIVAATLAVVTVGRRATPIGDIWVASLFAITVVTSGLLLANVRRRSAARMQRIREAIERMREGHFGHPINDTGGDEIGELAVALEQLRESTARRLTKLTRRAGVIEAVLMAVPEGLVAVGPAGDVRFANRAAQQLIGFRVSRSGLREPSSQEMRELLAELLEQLRITKAPARSRSQFQEEDAPVLSLHAVPIEGESDLAAVFVIYDDTELSRAESLRQEFVANVSHELKTPLSSIKAYAETLSGGAIDDPPAQPPLCASD